MRPASLKEVAERRAATERPLWLSLDAFLDGFYEPDAPRSDMLEAVCLAESPTAFRRRFIFTEGRPLRRKGGPQAVQG